MPIYEFYCPDCHTVFSFFSARVDTEAKPACPHCGRPELGRKPSRFAALSSTGGASKGEDGEDSDPLGNLDEERMAGAMDALAAEMEGLDEEAHKDPKQLARFLSKFSEASGLEAGPRMQEMLAKLEEGTDPDELDAAMGDDSADEDEAGPEDFSDFFRPKRAPSARRERRPRVDETLYFL